MGRSWEQEHTEKVRKEQKERKGRSIQSDEWNTVQVIGGEQLFIQPEFLGTMGKERGVLNREQWDMDRV